MLTPTRAPLASRVRRIALTSALICLIPVLVSYVHALTQRSNSDLGIRTVEWLRDNGARGIVGDIESIYYSLTAPSKGGPPLKALPRQAGIAGAILTEHRVAHRSGITIRPVGTGGPGLSPSTYRPPPIRPLISPALPGEGVWHPTFAGRDAGPPVLITSFRSDPSYPQMVAGVAWFDHTRTSTWLYPGLLEPSVSMPSRGPMEVPVSLRHRLAASFNSGFKLADSGGGFAIGGHTYAPLHDGLATIVRYRSGKVDIRAWTGGPDVGPDLVYARQNLPLIVDHGMPNPNLSDGPEWGATLGNAIRVWRSAVGIDQHGNLIYGAANYQTVGSLAAIMIHAGAVRAMELDINSYWVSLITYRHDGSLDPSNLLPSMNRSSDRYLTQDDRDFFAVYAR